VQRYDESSGAGGQRSAQWAQGAIDTKSRSPDEGLRQPVLPMGGTPRALSGE